MFKEYKAETQRLMGMMVNSIYTHKEIFLREIISNASDAIDKRCFESLVGSTEPFDRAQAEIRIRIDKPGRCLIVEDNGIGMDEKDLENNLGVIAKSGSLEFASKNAGKEDASSIIGQFGVGFYSAFMVADKVVVRTRKLNSNQGYEWVSTGAEGYEISPAKVESTGTTVIMHIKEDGTEKDEFSCYLREYPIYKLIRKYSNYIRWPIRMLMPHPQLKPGCDPKNPEYVESFEYETLNSMVPIWKKPKSEVSDEDYKSFYKEHFSDKADPLKYITVSVDGNISYQALLYIPSVASDTYGTDSYESGLELYSNGVRIMEHCSTLVPEYFNFVRGIVETSDINLNISREMLQQDLQLKLIRQSLEKKIRDTLDRMLKNERSTYEAFFSKFGVHLKACAMEEYAKNQDKLQDLLLFPSFRKGGLVTLAEYTAAMQEGQKNIYYITARSIDEAMNLPQVEVFREHNYDMLLFVEKVDELVAQMFGNYHDHLFKSAINGSVEFGASETKAKTSKENQAVLDFVKNALGSKVDEVCLSQRLRNHPVVLTSGDGITFEMEKYFRSISPNMPMHSKKILELNAEHQAFAKLKDAIDKDPERAGKYAQILFQQGCLMAGLGIENPTEYTDLICSLW